MNSMRRTKTLTWHGTATVRHAIRRETHRSKRWRRSSSGGSTKSKRRQLVNLAVKKDYHSDRHSDRLSDRQDDRRPQKKKSIKCILCDKPHRLVQCPRYYLFEELRFKILRERRSKSKLKDRKHSKAYTAKEKYESTGDHGDGARYPETSSSEDSDALIEESDSDGI
jgi:hypothetical protein